jgi:hypothetical protein
LLAFYRQTGGHVFSSRPSLCYFLCDRSDHNFDHWTLRTYAVSVKVWEIKHSFYVQISFKREQLAHRRKRPEINHTLESNASKVEIWQATEPHNLIV